MRAFRFLEKHRELHWPSQGDSDRVADAAYSAAIADLEDGDVVHDWQARRPERKR
jgi:hypothetical protein